MTLPASTAPDLIVALLAALLGSLVGSFGNVVVWRLPRGASVVAPGSACPSCGRRLGPVDLVPVLSWVALRGRCRTCREPISARYPLVEAAFALLFLALALRWPPLLLGWTALVPTAVLAMLLMAALIDLDTFELPDALTLPAVAIGIAGAWLYPSGAGLPSPGEAAFGAAVGAGVLALVNRVGGLVLRRFADTRERLWPIGMDQVGVAALGGALGGWGWGLAAAGASALLNLAARRPLRLPEPLVYGLWGLALAASGNGPLPGPVEAIGGSVAAAGGAALLGAATWWIAEMAGAPEPEPDGSEDEPVAMGFGDVKLIAALGALLGWQGVLVALLLSFVIGAIGGVAGRLAGGSRQVPFGPYLLLGGLAALFAGDAIVAAYLGMLGL